MNKEPDRILTVDGHSNFQFDTNAAHITTYQVSCWSSTSQWLVNYLIPVHSFQSQRDLTGKVAGSATLPQHRSDFSGILWAYGKWGSQQCNEKLSSWESCSLYIYIYNIQYNIYIYTYDYIDLEPVCPLFWGFNPPVRRRPVPIKTRVIGFQGYIHFTRCTVGCIYIYLYIHMTYVWTICIWGVYVSPTAYIWLLYIMRTPLVLLGCVHQRIPNHGHKQRNLFGLRIILHVAWSRSSTMMMICGFLSLQSTSWTSML